MNEHLRDMNYASTDYHQVAKGDDLRTVRAHDLPRAEASGYTLTGLSAAPWRDSDLNGWTVDGLRSEKIAPVVLPVGIWKSTRFVVDFDEREFVRGDKVIVGPDQFDAWAEEFLKDKMFFETSTGRIRMVPPKVEWNHEGYVGPDNRFLQEAEFFYARDIQGHHVTLHHDRHIAGQGLEAWVKEGVDLTYMNHHAIFEMEELSIDFNPLEVEICRDCFEYAIGCMYSDFSGMEDEVFDRLDGKVPALFSIGERVNEFSRVICDSCGSRLAGERFGAILAE